MGRLDLDLVRFIAVLLITNSHFDAYYSDPRFATGGAIGNALFFFLSGYGLTASSMSSNGSAGYLRWLGLRLYRIYLPLWVLLGVLFAMGVPWFYEQLSVRLFVWPSVYWFVCAIAVFYVVFPPLMGGGGRAFALAGGCVFVVYQVWYWAWLDLTYFSIESAYFSWCYYFGVMVLGGWCATPSGRKLIELIAQRARSALVVLVCFVGFYFAYKVGFSRGVGRSHQWVLHLITIGMVILAVGVASRYGVVGPTKWVSFVRAVARMSLEVYLVQVVLLPQLWLQSTSERTSDLFAWGVVFGAAYLLHFLTGYVGKILPWGSRPGTDKRRPIIREA